jgi:preprotein translocase subunit SecE
MAKNKKSKKGGLGTDGGGTATLPNNHASDSTHPQTDTGSGGNGSIASNYGDDGGHGGSGGGGRGAPGPGFFGLYKPGQGLYTRVGTAIGAGLIALFGSHFMYERITSENAVVKMGIPFLFLALCGAIIYWVVGSYRKTNDFFIDTEGEMKKVSWSTRREVIGSTKVVLLFTVLMASILFLVDIAFMFFFSAIGVLELDIWEMLGLGGNG